MLLFETRSYQGTLIARRTADGYVNATAMCKANGKQWAGYFRTDRATQYLEALASSLQIRTDELYQAKEGGNGGGTWVHPQVAVDLARWISAPFAVWMDGWFLESAGKPADPQPVAALPGQALATVDHAISLLDRLGGVDDRSQQILRDVVLNATAQQAGGSVAQLGPIESENYVTVSEYLIEIGVSPHKAGKLATNHGKTIKQAYRRQHGEDPKSVIKYVNGGNRPVALYPREWLATAKIFPSDFNLN